jgi:MscS family membrane protein
VRVRFIRLGQFSLDIDVSAYLIARDWNHFLELQERLLFAVTEIVQAAGTEIAFPSQTMYISNAQMAPTPEHPVTTR